jgi:molecular chaperone GrpE
MSSPEERNGPVIRDLRRIDPATGRVRDPGQPGRPGQGGPAQPGGPSRGPAKPRPGRHAVSKPGGGATGTEAAAAAGGSQGSAAGAGPRQGQDRVGADRRDAARPAAEQRAAEQLAERTADLQRVTAEYANYRKRVERDRVAVREQALANVLQGLLPVLDDIGRAREHGELVGGFKSVAESLEAAVAKLGLESFGDSGEPFDPKVHEALMHSYSSDVTEPTCVQILQPGYRVGERILRPARVAVAEPDGSGEAGQADEDDQTGEPEGPWDPEGSAGFPGSPGPGNPRGNAQGAGPRERRNHN